MHVTELLEQDHNLVVPWQTVATLYRDFTEKLIRNIGPDEREHLRFMEFERLDDMQASLWDQASGGDTRAVETVLKVMAQRQKLAGLDMPTGTDRAAQMNVLVVGQDKESFIQALRAGKVAGGSRDDED